MPYELFILTLYMGGLSLVFGIALMLAEVLGWD